MTGSPENAMACRLCSGALAFCFEGRLLRRHDVHYLECQACGSLQTEQPHWLGEAYEHGNLALTDTGAAQRNLDNLGACLALAHWLGLKRVVDHGGGDGLLCRLLRDRGLDAHVLDRYAAPKYAAGFDRPGGAPPDLVLAFEVVEHFAHPAQELSPLFEGKPPVVLVSTEAWQGQGPNWAYLSPLTGQHIFFYSPKALQQLAAARGYRVLGVNGYWLFVREGAYSHWRIRLARRLLKPRWRRWSTAWAATRKTPGIMRDHDAMLQRLAQMSEKSPDR